MAKILIVDDSNTILKMITRKLTESGHEIVGTGQDGEEGVRLFREKQPDLVLLDITMPNKDGRACLEEIIAIKSSAKVIMLSSVSTDDVMKECIRLGARAFISKADLPSEGVVEKKIAEILGSS
jgi:two-component system chemotaxis response regulator CheY